uniref:Uncharacterized protein n=1 Tax=Arundo donax TaxID=35708 RepID=A0A0A9FZ56_ARUDO
MLGPPVGAEAW